MIRRTDIGTAITNAVTLVLCMFTLVSCGSRQTGTDTDPLSLLRQGRFPEARIAAVEAGLDSDTNRAVAALTYIADSPVKSSALLTVKTLNRDVGSIRSAAVATEMLTLAFELPSPTPELSLLAAETALGAVSYGPYSPGTKPILNVGAASRNLSGAVLERAALALSRPDAHIDRQRLQKIWNACYSLDGGTFEAEDDAAAWRLFTSIGAIAVFLAKSDPIGDLTNVLLGAAVTVVETNPDIAIAARCDIASPFDDLKAAMAYKRELLARLEAAVKDAVGCSRGTYAPTGSDR